jgi:hypothetical protein
MSSLRNFFKFKRQTQQEEGETFILIFGYFLCVLSIFLFYVTFTEGLISNSFFTLLFCSILVSSLAFMCLSPWRRINLFIAATLVSSIGCLSLILLFDYKKDDYWTALAWSIFFSVWGASLFAKAFGKTLSGLLNEFFSLKKVKTARDILKSFFKFIFWTGTLALIVWFIIALGPLWIIAITMLLILFVLVNK